MFILHYQELIGKIEEHEGKKCLMIDDYMLDKISGNIKEITGIAKFDNTKILINTDDLIAKRYYFEKCCMMLMTCIIKDNNNFYAQLFLEEALLEA